VIVCSCNVISDHQVRSVAAGRTMRRPSEVYKCLSCSADFGRCGRAIRDIMDESITSCSADKERVDRCRDDVDEAKEKSRRTT